MTLHSLSFASKEIEANIHNNFHHLPPGSEITLTGDNTPIAVNVKIHIPENPTKYKSEALERLRQFSLHEDDIIIPLLPNTGTDSTRFKFTVPGNHPRYKPGRIETSYVYAFELALAMTIHKAQGRTISSVILALSPRPSKLQQMVFSALYVAFSRVQEAEDIRIFVHNDADCVDQCLEDLLYIVDLKPSPYVLAFYDGFLPNHCWNAKAAYESYISLMTDLATDDI